MRQHNVEKGKFEEIEYFIEEIERPPMIEIEAYVRKFHAEKQVANSQ